VAEQASAFDPYELLAAFQRHHFSNFVVIGGFARVIHGTGEVTDGLDITPSLRPSTLSLLEKALTELEAERVDGKPFDLGDRSEPVIELRTRAGELKIVPEPAGTHGYDDLRWHAGREALGRSLRPQVASPADLARMVGALGRENQIPTLLRLRRMIELERGLTHDRGHRLER